MRATVAALLAALLAALARFAGAGYGRSTFSRPASLPGIVVRSSEWDWAMQGGVGVVIRRLVYVEAMYVQYQTDPKSA